MRDQKEVWGKIADSWHELRKSVFHPIIEEIAVKWKPARLLDIGCGNGRNSKPFAERGFSCIGLDFSENMLKHAALPNKIVADASVLPLRDASFEYCLCASIIQCIPSKEKRHAALKEMRRVLKPYGQALLTSWKKEAQEKHDAGKKTIWLSPCESEVKWGKVWRYYYFFDSEELKQLCAEASFTVKDIEDERNIILLLKKTAA